MKLDEALETLKNNGAEVIKESVAEDVYDDIFETIYDMSQSDCDELCYIIKEINHSSRRFAEDCKETLIGMLKGLK